MAALLFDTCCGCIELRTGCLIIGYLNLVISIITIIATLVLGLAVATAASDPDIAHKYNIDEKLTQISKTEATAALSVVAVIFIIIFLLFFTFNIVFLVGIHKDKRGHVKAYLIFHVIFLILYTVSFLASFAGHINGGDVASKLLSILLSIYFFLVIRSYYYKMADTNRQPAIYNTA